LVNGVLADALGRQQATVSGTIVFIIGVIVQACAKNVDYILGGRFVTGLGVGILSMIVPLYGQNIVLQGLLVTTNTLSG
jgi:MFS family permease